MDVFNPSIQLSNTIFTKHLFDICFMSNLLIPRIISPGITTHSTRNLVSTPMWALTLNNKLRLYNYYQTSTDLCMSSGLCEIIQNKSLRIYTCKDLDIPTIFAFMSNGSTKFNFTSAAVSNPKVRKVFDYDELLPWRYRRRKQLQAFIF